MCERELADDEGPIFSTVAKLVDALRSALFLIRFLIRATSNCGMKPCASDVSCYAAPSASRSDERTARGGALALRPAPIRMFGI